MQVLPLEKQVGNYAEHYQGDDLLYDLQLHQREWPAVVDKADTIRWHEEAVLYACNHPRETYHGNQRPVGRDAGLVEFQVSVPCKRHEDIAAN